MSYILFDCLCQAILECMRCMTSADEKGMMAALGTVNDSLLKMTSTLTELSRESFNNLIFISSFWGQLALSPPWRDTLASFYVRSLLGLLMICQLVVQ